MTPRSVRLGRIGAELKLLQPRTTCVVAIASHPLLMSGPSVVSLAPSRSTRDLDDVGGTDTLVPRNKLRRLEWHD